MAAISTASPAPAIVPTTGIHSNSAAMSPIASAPGRPMSHSPTPRNTVSIAVSFNWPWKNARVVASTRSNM